MVFFEGPAPANTGVGRAAKVLPAVWTSQLNASVPPDLDRREPEASSVTGVPVCGVPGLASAAVGGVRPAAPLKLPRVTMSAVVPDSATTLDAVRLFEAMTTPCVVPIQMSYEPLLENVLRW